MRRTAGSNGSAVRRDPEGSSASQATSPGSLIPVTVLVIQLFLSTRKVLNMKRVMLALLMLGLFSPALIGCSDKTSTTKKTETTTPGGTTTTTKTDETKTSGENPPAPANEPAK
jgi:hypothetical protein